jgi:hypothetical protein
VEDIFFEDDDKDSQIAQLGFANLQDSVWGCWKDEWAAIGSPSCDNVDDSSSDQGLLK